MERAGLRQLTILLIVLLAASCIPARKVARPVPVLPRASTPGATIAPWPTLVPDPTRTPSPTPTAVPSPTPTISATATLTSMAQPTVTESSLTPGPEDAELADKWGPPYTASVFVTAILETLLNMTKDSEAGSTAWYEGLAVEVFTGFLEQAGAEIEAWEPAPDQMSIKSDLQQRIGDTAVALRQWRDGGVTREEARTGVQAVLDRMRLTTGEIAQAMKADGYTLDAGLEEMLEQLLAGLDEWSPEEAE
jgi:hypothetical protein